MTTQPQPAPHLDLDTIQARADAATPGEWVIEWDTDDVEDTPFPVSLGPIAYLEHHGERAEADAQFIAHARTDVPALIARVRQLEQQLAAVLTLLPADPAEDINASWIKPRHLRAALDGDPADRAVCAAPHPVSDRTRCERPQGHNSWHAANGNGWPNPILPGAASGPAAPR